MFKNLIFDWSGTLVDDLALVIDATNHTMRHFGKPEFDREMFRREFRLPYDGFYEDLLPNVDLAELEDVFRAGFAESTSDVPVLPHARETLEWCTDHGVRLFVLSSMDAKAFKEQAEEHGLLGFFEETYAGVMNKKERIHHILETHGLQAEETAFVGDMIHDVETAHHAGVASIAVLSGYNHPEVLAKAEPTITLSHVGGLPKLLAAQAANERPVSTVGAVIEKEGEILMVRTHKWSNLWGIPGGKIRRGEGSLEALHREIYEETRLEVESVRFVCVQDCIDSPEFERPAHFLLLNYVATWRSGDVVLNEEAEEFAWVSVKEAFEMDLNKPTRYLLDKVYNE